MGVSHFYLPDGSCITGLREARKHSPLPFPSPTTVLSLLRSEGLLYYFRKQMWEATLTTKRQPHWTDDQDFEQCKKYADEHGKAARDKGTDLHDQIRDVHRRVIGPATSRSLPEPLRTQVGLYVDWYGKYVAKPIATEQVVIGNGYAGRLDHLCLLRDGRVAVTDIKSQDNSGRGHFNYYPEWSLQLGAYAAAVGQLSTEVDVIISVVISSKEPVVLESYTWPEKPDYYAELFLKLLALWRHWNQYD